MKHLSYVEKSSCAPPGKFFLDPPLNEIEHSISSSTSRIRAPSLCFLSAFSGSSCFIALETIDFADDFLVLKMSATCRESFSFLCARKKRNFSSHAILCLLAMKGGATQIKFLSLLTNASDKTVSQSQEGLTRKRGLASMRVATEVLKDANGGPNL